MLKDKESVIDLENEMNIIEEFLNVDTSLIAMEKDRDLIRMEMNIVEFPIFSKSNNIKKNQIKKYYFSSNKESYLEIIPAYDSMIPGELEERVFIALTKIYRNNGFKQTFYCTITDIYDNMNITSANTRRSLYGKVKQAISKLQSTSFNFKDLFYSNEINSVFNDLIKTNILNYRVISLKDANNSESNFFSDKRIKEVYKITLSEHFHDNITRKGYLAFDADDLLNIKDPITRSIFTMITKWRFSNLVLVKPAFFIARRIPLSWESNPRRTVLRIEKSLMDLKELNHILDYELIKKGKWDTAEFKIHFSLEHNKMKNMVFYDEKAITEKMIHLVEDRQNELAINTPDFFNDPHFESIFSSFPETARKLKSLPLAIREALKKYDYNYVKYTAEYTGLFCKTSYLKYFKEALLNNWAEEYIVKKEAKAEKKAKKIENIPSIEEAIIVEPEKKSENLANWDEFMGLPKLVQEEISTAAYEEYLLETGATDSKLIRGIFEKGKKSYILKTMEKYSSQEPEIIEETIEKIEVQEPIEKPIEEPKKSAKEPKASTKKQKDNSNEIIGEYVSIPQFMVRVRELSREKNITLNFEDLVPIFKLFGEYEDEFIKISYDEATKQGKINIK